MRLCGAQGGHVTLEALRPRAPQHAPAATWTDCQLQYSTDTWLCQSFGKGTMVYLAQSPKVKHLVKFQMVAAAWYLYLVLSGFQFKLSRPCEARLHAAIIWCAPLGNADKPT